MACKRGGSLFLQSISSSLIRNRNHNTRALSICNGKRTSHPNTVSINKMEEAQGIPTEQAKATSTEEVPNENAQVLRIESIEKKLVELLGEFRAANDIRRHEIMYEFEKEAAKLEHEFRDWIKKESANERSKADKAFSKLKKEFNQARRRTNIAYYCALSVVIAILAKRWL